MSDCKESFSFFEKCRSSFHVNEFFKSHDLKVFFEATNNWGKCFLFFFQFFYQIFGIISKDQKMKLISRNKTNVMPWAILYHLGTIYTI